MTWIGGPLWMIRPASATNHHGCRMPQRCRAYAPRMNPAHAFSHLTAAELYRFPLPAGGRSLQLHVSAPSPARAPGGRGIVGHQSRLSPLDVVSLHGLRVVSPAVAWCQATETLSVDDAVAIGDWVVTGSPFQNVLPLATLDELAEASGVRSPPNRRSRPHRRR